MRFVCLLLLLLPAALRAQESLILAAALRDPQLTIAITAGPPLALSIQNRSAHPVTLRQPAGLICKASAGDSRVVTLRALDLTIGAGAAVDATIPAARMTLGEPAKSGALLPTDETAPRLAALLGYFAAHDDIPQLTAQLLVSCVQEDVSFAQWLRASGVPVGTEPTAAQIVAGIDALCVLRQIAPQQQFALAADPELKLRALRLGATRGKAMQLYGIALPEAPLPPELGTLLHTKPGDNCPICRQRALMQPREDGL